MAVERCGRDGCDLLWEWRRWKAPPGFAYLDGWTFSHGEDHIANAVHPPWDRFWNLYVRGETELMSNGSTRAPRHVLQDHRGNRISIHTLRHCMITLRDWLVHPPPAAGWPVLSDPLTWPGRD